MSILYMILSFIILILDNSGRWGKGGVFSAISARSPQPGIHYTLAGKMKGTVHDYTCPLNGLSLVDYNNHRICL